MKFNITKTSDYDLKESPYSGSVLVRDEEWGFRAWEIEIDSIEKLLSIAKECRVVVGFDDNTLPCIEIYDDYRE